MTVQDLPSGLLVVLKTLPPIRKNGPSLLGAGVPKGQVREC